MSKTLSTESMVLCGICLADLASTIFLVSYRGAIEGNPLMSYYLDHGIATFILAKLTLFAFPLFIIEWARRHRPKFAIMASRACIGLYLFAYISTVVQLNGMTAPIGKRIAMGRDPYAASMGLGK